MSDNKNNGWKKWFGSGEGKKIAPKFIFVLLGLGIVLMFSGSLFQKKVDMPTLGSTSTEPKDIPTFSQKGNLQGVEKYEKQYEDRLKEVLESIQGVKDVTVVVNLASTDSKVLEKERVSRSQKTNETDPNGGTRVVEDQSTEEKPVVTRGGDKEVPIVIREEKPVVRGVAITAKGVDNIEVKKMVIDTVTRYLGVPNYRVAVSPKKN